jgi:hypothetical protein
MVEPHRLGDDADVGADALAQRRDLVDIGDFRRQKAFEAYLMSSAVSRFVDTIGVSDRNSGR